VLDGIQGRANVLCITTMWNAFKFVMIPIGLALVGVFPPETFGVLYAFIWLSYAVADIASEVFGSLLGRHGIRVWGLGDINRKSWEGVAAAFVCTLAVNLVIVATNGLSPAWWALALVISVMNPIVELASPRGTDDFTMATANALICWAFGVWVL
jgi:dolichol kinase